MTIDEICNTLNKFSFYDSNKWISGNWIGKGDGVGIRQTQGNRWFLWLTLERAEQYCKCLLAGCSISASNRDSEWDQHNC